MAFSKCLVKKTKTKKPESLSLTYASRVATHFKRAKPTAAWQYIPYMGRSPMKMKETGA